LNNETNSSPLQRLGAFFLGLLTFVGFGILAWIVFHLTGGETDSNYEMKSAARAEKNQRNFNCSRKWNYSKCF
jgi:hypothetical protein